MRSRARISLLAFVFAGLAVLACARGASAIYLDEDREVSLRARVYSQAAIRTEDSQKDTVPSVKTGQLVQHRNFYNPEFDAKLTKYTKWMSNIGLGAIQPDDFSFRIAGWGFYDGIYDYGTSQFGDNLKSINSTYPDPLSKGAFFLRGDSFRCPSRVNGDPSKPGFKGLCVEDASTTPVTSIKSIRKLFPGHDLQEPRDIYAHEERVNELYLSYAKGPVFVRLGRQAISWGEADTIALLDQNNPFDISRGAPGAFQDLDEARIPLWTLRASLDIYEELGPFQSGMIEAYWVPGFIDTNTGDFPILTASPYSPRGKDPQLNIASFNAQQQFVLFDHLPEEKMSNSRYGFRFQTIIARDHTFSLWYYTHFPNAPVPRSLGSARVLKEDGRPTRLYTVETVHELTGVFGASDAFYLEPVDSIFRIEAEYFRNEPSFIPETNLGAQERSSPDYDPIKQLEYVGKVPKADYLRWEVGMDRNIFIRPLNPSNSFLIVGAIVGSWNIDERNGKDFRMQGQRTPGEIGTTPDDFVQQRAVEAFGQIRIGTSYLHGKLEPSVITIGNLRGTHAVIPTLDFRINDWLLFGIKYVHIAGAYQQLGFYRDRDQVSLRATYQLN